MTIHHLADFDVYISSFNKTGVFQSLKKGGHSDLRIQIRIEAGQNTDHPSRLLRACRRHPRCRAAQKGDELAPSHGPSLTPRTIPYHIVKKAVLCITAKLGRRVSFRIKMRSTHPDQMSAASDLGHCSTRSALRICDVNRHA